MAELDIRKLGVTLRSTSGTIAFANEIYDESKHKFQNEINAELSQSIESAAGVNGVKAGDKVLSVEGNKVSSTLSLSYEKKTGDSVKKIYLNGIGGETIASIDTTEFTKDKFVQEATLVETAESGVNVETPYIKLVFNDSTAPVRFSVKSLVDTYNGANLKLSPSYSSTAGAVPSNGVPVDAAIKNVASRIESLEGLEAVSSIGGQSGAITLKGDNTENGAVNLSIDGTKKMQASVVGLKSAAFQESSAFAPSSALQEVEGASSSAYATLSASGKTSNKQTVTIGLTTIGVENATEASDGLATASDVKDYVTKIKGQINTAQATALAAVEEKADQAVTDVASLGGELSNLSSTVSNNKTELDGKISTLTSGAYKGIKEERGSDFASLSISEIDANKQQSVAVNLVTASVKTGGMGLATSSDVYATCIMSTVVGSTEYADFENIIKK